MSTPEEECCALCATFGSMQVLQPPQSHTASSATAPGVREEGSHCSILKQPSLVETDCSDRECTQLSIS